MQDLYFIITTILFGLFVVFMAFLMWRALMKPQPEEVTDNEREIIYAFCDEQKGRPEVTERKK